jgi:hypothetical protein
MMSVHDARPGDVYVDSNGKLWRVVWVCDQPTLSMKAIEPESCASVSERKAEGAITGLMWNGFKRIYRKAETP